MLKANGIEPVPDRPASMSWQTLLKAHWDTIFAVDFTTVEVWAKTGLTTFYVMVLMGSSSRRVEIARITINPNWQWITQIVRYLTGHTGFPEHALQVNLDRDTCFHPLRGFLKEQTESLSRMIDEKSENGLPKQEDLFQYSFEQVLSNVSPVSIETKTIKVLIIS